MLKAVLAEPHIVVILTTTSSNDAVIFVTIFLPHTYVLHCLLSKLLPFTYVTSLTSMVDVSKLKDNLVFL